MTCVKDVEPRRVGFYTQALRKNDSYGEVIVRSLVEEAVTYPGGVGYFLSELVRPGLRSKMHHLLMVQLRSVFEQIPIMEHTLHGGVSGYRSLWPGFYLHTARHATAANLQAGRVQREGMSDKMKPVMYDQEVDCFETLHSLGRQNGAHRCVFIDAGVWTPEAYSQRYRSDQGHRVVPYLRYVTSHSVYQVRMAIYTLTCDWHHTVTPMYTLAGPRVAKHTAHSLVAIALSYAEVGIVSWGDTKQADGSLNRRSAYMPEHMLSPATDYISSYVHPPMYGRTGLYVSSQSVSGPPRVHARLSDFAHGVRVFPAINECAISSIVECEHDMLHTANNRSVVAFPIEGFRTQCSSINADGASWYGGTVGGEVIPTPEDELDPVWNLSPKALAEDWLILYRLAVHLCITHNYPATGEWAGRSCVTEFCARSSHRLGLFMAHGPRWAILAESVLSVCHQSGTTLIQPTFSLHGVPLSCASSVPTWVSDEPDVRVSFTFFADLGAHGCFGVSGMRQEFTPRTRSSDGLGGGELWDAACVCDTTGVPVLGVAKVTNERDRISRKEYHLILDGVRYGSMEYQLRNCFMSHYTKADEVDLVRFFATTASEVMAADVATGFGLSDVCNVPEKTELSGRLERMIYLRHTTSSVTNFCDIDGKLYPGSLLPDKRREFSMSSDIWGGHHILPPMSAGPRTYHPETKHLR